MTDLQKVQKYLIDNGLDDLILNRNKYRENTPENAKHWVYVSDLVLKAGEILGDQMEILKEIRELKK